MCTRVVWLGLQALASTDYGCNGDRIYCHAACAYASAVLLLMVLALGMVYASMVLCSVCATSSNSHCDS